MRRALGIATFLVTAVAVAGCGGDPPETAAQSSGSGAAQRLLAQASGGHHVINSGVIKLDLKVVPSGSSTLTGPIELSFGGPFTSAGAGKPPESDFTISISADGQASRLEVISADGRGYITVAGQSYQMPASSFKSLASGLGAPGSSGGKSGATSSGAFSKLGVEPLHWLVKPRILGSADVDGVKTTHIRAGLDSAAMLQALNKLLAKASLLGASGASGGSGPSGASGGSGPSGGSGASGPSGKQTLSISPAKQRSIAHALGSPTVNVWTGAADQLIRKLTVDATIPVTGQTRRLLGGLRSATVTLAFQYSDLNQPQTITAPTATKPYSVFQTEATTLLQEIEGGASGGTGTGTAGTGTSTTGTGTSTTGSSTGSSAGVIALRKYTHCITTAAGDVSKMQKCASLLGSG